MKIEEMSTDKAVDALCAIAEPISEIVEDDEVMDALNKFVNADPTKQSIMLMGKVAPILLRKHRHAVYHILSELNNKTIEQIRNQSISDTIADINKAMSADLQTFFTSYAEKDTAK